MSAMAAAAAASAAAENRPSPSPLRATLCNRVFLSLLVFNVLGCFLINFGMEYASITQWGAIEPPLDKLLWKDVVLPTKVFLFGDKSKGIDTDLMLTSFGVGFFVTLFGADQSIASVRHSDCPICLGFSVGRILVRSR